MECYLAMTAAEIAQVAPLPARLAWMACHFSAYGTGLSNLPQSLPPGSVLLVNDRTPMSGHDPLRIRDQLAQAVDDFSLMGIVLDLQRPDHPQAVALVEALKGAFSCKLAVSPSYSIPGVGVFLPPPPVNCPLQNHLKPWQGYEIWLEAELSAQKFCVGPDGCKVTPLPAQTQPLPHPCPDLFCHYHATIKDDLAEFCLHRTKQDLQALLQAAEDLGVVAALGLYQELGAFPQKPDSESV